MDKTRGVALARGTWEPDIPAGTTRVRIHLMLQAGWTKTAIAKAANLSDTAIATIIGERGAPCRRVRPSTYRAIMALPIVRDLQDVPDEATVDACGVRRRLQALQALGWPREEIERRAQVYLSGITNGRKKTVTAGLARQVIAVYRQLWNQPGPSERARKIALEKGYVLPASWDDDEIDLPGAGPYLPTATSTRLEIIADEAQTLLSQGYPRRIVAERLGISKSYLDKALAAAALVGEANASTNESVTELRAA